MKYILVTGAREYLLIHRLIIQLMEEWDNSTVIHGDCSSGIDAETKNLCTIHNIPQLRFKPDWNKYHKGAGPIRNQAMVDFMIQMKNRGHEVICLAFPLIPRRKGSGTWDCIDRIKKAGLPLREYPAESVTGKD